MLHALAKLRKELAKQIPQLPRGRPRRDKESLAKRRKVKRLKERLAELFEHRYLFVQRRLTRAQQKVLARLMRGRPQLRALRGIMTEVYQPVRPALPYSHGVEEVEPIEDAGAAFQASG